MRNFKETDDSPLLIGKGIEEEEDEFIEVHETLYNTIRVPILALSYCAASISAVFLNKKILSRTGQFKDFRSVEFLMMLQSVVGALLLVLCRLFRIIKFPIIIDFERVKRIALVNILFVLMTLSNAYSVRQLSIPMVALLKNCQVVIVCFLEYIFIGTKPGKMTIASLCLIVFGSVCGSVTDLEFNLPGYIAMIIAVSSSALYHVSIKLVFKEKQVPEFTLVFYNNVLSIPFFIIMGLSANNVFFRAFRNSFNAPLLFWVITILSGVAGVGVNITTYLFLSASTPTSFSVLGVIKKITQTLLGYLTWNTPANAANILSVCIGIMGGISYTIAKKMEKKESRKLQRI